MTRSSFFNWPLVAAPAALLLAIGAAPSLQDDAPASAQDPAAGEEQAETPLEQAMLEIQEGIRALRRSLRKPETRADALATLAEIQAAVIRAKSETPRRMARVPEQEKAAFADAYRGEMLELLESMIRVERALLKGEREVLMTEFKSLRAMEDPAHERFLDEEE